MVSTNQMSSITVISLSNSVLARQQNNYPRVSLYFVVITCEVMNTSNAVKCRLLWEFRT